MACAMPHAIQCRSLGKYPVHAFGGVSCSRRQVWRSRAIRREQRRNNAVCPNARCSRASAALQRNIIVLVKGIRALGSLDTAERAVFDRLVADTRLVETPKPFPNSTHVADAGDGNLENGAREEADGNVHGTHGNVGVLDGAAAHGEEDEATVTRAIVADLKSHIQINH